MVYKSIMFHGFTLLNTTHCAIFGVFFGPMFSIIPPVVGPHPLKRNDFVSWDDDIPNINAKIKIDGNHSPPTKPLICYNWIQFNQCGNTWSGGAPWSSYMESVGTVLFSFFDGMPMNHGYTPDNMIYGFASSIPFHGNPNIMGTEMDQYGTCQWFHMFGAKYDVAATTLKLDLPNKKATLRYILRGYQPQTTVDSSFLL